MANLAAQYGLTSYPSNSDPVRFGTVAALPAYTRAGNVITANANGAMAAQDGVTPAATNRMCLRNGAAGEDDGVYDVTDLGTAGTPFVLTRAVDWDSSAKVKAGKTVMIMEGTTLANTTHYVSAADPITLNTTPMVFRSLDAELGFTARGYVQTADATVTSVLARTIPNGQARLVFARVVGRDAAGAQVASYVMSALFRAAGGAVTQVGATNQISVNEDDAAWEATLDATGATYRVRVTGEAATVVDWDCNVLETVGYAR